VDFREIWQIGRLWSKEESVKFLKVWPDMVRVSAPKCEYALKQNMSTC